MKRLIVVIIVLLAASPIFAGSWYPVIIHIHSTKSDGGETPKQLADSVVSSLAKTGYNEKCFAIVCDHFDGVARHFNEYVAAIRAASNGKITMIPCLELGSKWRPELSTIADANMLAIGILPNDFAKLADCYDTNTSGTGLPLVEKFDYQQRLIDEILAMGMLPVAAHPTQLVIGGTTSLRHDNRFDTRNCLRLRAVEVLNNLGLGQDQECIDFIMRLIANGQLVFITAGCDYHGTVASSIPDSILGSLERVTWVYAEDSTEEAILKAISEGKTYAASDGLTFIDFSRLGCPEPGFTVHGAEQIRICAQVYMAGKNTKMTVYRDGEQVYEQSFGNSERKSFLTLGKSSGENSGWVDTNATVGINHYYIVRVVSETKLGQQTVLITSPIVMRLRPEGLTASFFDSVKTSDITEMEAKLTIDPTLASARDSRGYETPLHSYHPLALSVACALGSVEAVKSLLEHGAKPNDNLKTGEPGPLMEVARNGDCQKCQLLLQYGANVNIHTDGNNPLIWAINADFPELAKLLINNGANVNLPGDSGDTPLKRAQEHNMPEIEKLLIAKGANK